MRGLDWCDNELERTAVGILLQPLMHINDTALRFDPSAIVAARCILMEPGGFALNRRNYSCKMPAKSTSSDLEKTAAGIFLSACCE